MSADAVRVGPPGTPSTTTAGTPGATDEVRTFAMYARPCIVTNVSAEDLYVLVNEGGATASNYLLKLAAGQAVDASIGGHINVRSVSLYFAATAYTSALVKGWL